MLYKSPVIQYLPMEPYNKELFDLPTQAKLAELYIYHSPAIMAILTPDMRYAYWSKAWESFFGLNGVISQGDHHYEIFPDIPTSKPEWVQDHISAVKGKKISSSDEYLGKKFERNITPIYPVLALTKRVYHLIITIHQL